MNKLFLPGKQALLNIIKLLISDQAQGQVDIKNDMGLTPIELAERIRNDKDRAQVVAALTKAHGTRERRVQAEVRTTTKGPKKDQEKSAAQVLDSKNSKPKVLWNNISIDKHWFDIDEWLIITLKALYIHLK